MANSKNPFSELAFKVNVQGVLYFYGLLLLDILLIIGRSVRAIRQAFPEFFSHTSNLVISSILVAVISLIWLLQGGSL
jgi:glucan phosphoethanolaminetransferase (alkaline phosphatase superfamily)